MKIKISDLSSADILGATVSVKSENARRAGMTPPGRALPMATDQEVSDSYETVLEASFAVGHESIRKAESELNGPLLREGRKEFKERFDTAPPEKQDAAIAAAIQALK